MSQKSNPTDDLPMIPFAEHENWTEWLDGHHTESEGIWLKLAKKNSGIQSITYDEALDVALCYGWIDSMKKGFDDRWWLQKFSPRRPNSLWSKRNQEKIAELTAAGKMQPAGLMAVAEAKENGRWNAAYDSPNNATIPNDFQTELENNPQASAFFATLNSRNRYAILNRIQTATKPETRQKRIRRSIEMLEKNEKPYP